ncbi:hypothetical protein 1 [Hubei sobemo-like virus 12]|uniref:hypothetical protein 1 n=1 Tax=Hubei sobemo-like virus 12 TaxID=1923197 RepID=UPI0009099C99|nr:hypothetical protein 1 [Hubei sobemo-like virus 12]APG75823.1 hypothetical protein 1 [Hubei sobemo-like virus 12]
MGFRMDNNLITTLHVIDRLCEIQIKTDKGAVMVHKEEFQELDNEVVFAPYTQNMQVLGLAKYKIATVGMSMFDMAVVRIVGKMPYVRTSGLLKKNRSMFYVSYHGSTAKGFSGAPYVQGRNIYGMHMGSTTGTHNMGLDATYIQAMVRGLDEAYPWEKYKKRAARMKGKVTPSGGYLETHDGYKRVDASKYNDLVEQGIVDWGELMDKMEYDQPEADLPSANREHLEHDDSDSDQDFRSRGLPTMDRPRAVASNCPIAGISTDPAEVVFYPGSQQKQGTPILTNQTFQHSREFTDHLESILAQRNDLSPTIRRSLRKATNFLKSQAMKNSTESSKQ